MSHFPWRTVWNGEAIPRNSIPVLDIEPFSTALLDAVRRGGRVAAFFAVPDSNNTTSPVRSARLYAVLANVAEARLGLVSSRVSGSFPSLSNDLPELQRFEREIFEQSGIVPEGHPRLTPVRNPLVWRADDPETAHARVEGEEIHEVAVGPVHAGVIEPGHFRFQCHGERVFQLEIDLGFQHRGLERALQLAAPQRGIFLAETLAGDTTIGHASAYAQVCEALCDTPVSPRSEALRAIGLELERIANHTGDLGALAGDVGYLPTASFCGRIRGDFLQLTAQLCGSRFGRGWVRPAGMGFDLDATLASKIIQGLDRAFQETEAAVDLLWNAPSVAARFDGIGVISHNQAQALGLVGPVARASGLARDVRQDHPTGIYRFREALSSTLTGGDVAARAMLRWLEIEHSVTFARELLADLPAGDTRGQLGSMRDDACVVALVEGWRGEILHMALSGSTGQLEHYKVVDPSFHNWPGLELALRGQQISDFPVCNKSFNLSYCGHDL